MDQQERGDVLGDGVRIAARGVPPENVVRGAVRRVDMVVSDRCGCDEADRRAVEQVGIAFRAGAGDEGVRAAQVVPCDCCAGQTDEFGEPGKRGFGKKRNLVIRCNSYFFHDILIHPV